MFRKVTWALVILYLYVVGSVMILMGRVAIEKSRQENGRESQRSILNVEHVPERVEDAYCDNQEKAVQVNGEWARKNMEAARKMEKELAQTEEICTWNDHDALNLEFSAEEIQVLERIVEAEAGGEDEKGKLLVANVVLNRVRDEAFPNTISEVVFQRDGKVTQFSPVANGRYDAVVVSQETKEAVERALRGEDVSEGALYFAARKYADEKAMRWFDEKLTLLFQHGGHEFFK